MVAQQQAIGQSRERVGVRQSIDTIFPGLAVGDVAYHCGEPGRARGHADFRQRQFQREDAMKTRRGLRRRARYKGFLGSHQPG